MKTRSQSQSKRRKFQNAVEISIFASNARDFLSLDRRHLLLVGYAFVGIQFFGKSFGDFGEPLFVHDVVVFIGV